MNFDSILVFVKNADKHNMDPKGIDLLNITPVLITQAIKADRKLPQAIKPVEESGRSELRSNMEKAERELNAGMHNVLLQQRLQALALGLQRRFKKKWGRKVVLRWKWQDDQTLLCLEVLDEADGALLEQVSLQELVQAFDATDLSAHGLLLNKTV